MEHKIILTEKELYDIILNSYVDGFKYAEEYAEERGNWDSQGKDACSYTKKKIEELKK